jgi:hypothetical protein
MSGGLCEDDTAELGERGHKLNPARPLHMLLVVSLSLDIHAPRHSGSDENTHDAAVTTYRFVDIEP